MRKHLVASLVVSTVFVSASPASAGYRQAAYHTDLYSDSTYTTIVGEINPTCGFREVQYYLTGTYTQYSGPDQLVGYCVDGDWEML